MESKVSFILPFLHVEMVLLHIMIFLSLKISLYRHYANFKFVNYMKFSLQIYLKKETDLNTKF